MTDPTDAEREADHEEAAVKSERREEWHRDDPARPEARDGIGWIPPTDPDGPWGPSQSEREERY